MATDITIHNLFPAIRNTQITKPVADLFNTTFVGVDFGTSTTVVSIATLSKETGEILTEPIRLNQKMYDGAIMSSEKVPTVIAFCNQQLLVGQGASDLKYKLKKGINVWYSFKMELGEDLGAKFFNSELGRNSATPILNPKDAAKVFFQYLKVQIDRYIRSHHLPSNLQYAVSIPASFEANQRKELIYALEQNGIAINKQSLIDEPNAAFLSYVQASSYENNPLKLPEGDNPKVLVFDFGSGTCDVSILELGKDLKGVYSKNLSISKFEKLGGDDIDRLIAINYLFPKMLQESNRKSNDFNTPEKKRIVTQLLKFAEQLKILICESIALQMTHRILPEKATSEEYVSIGGSIDIETRKGNLKLTDPKLSYKDFQEVMKTFLKTSSIVPYRIKKFEDEFVTVFNPITTALKKANLSKDEIDYVLFIGGSSKNPYVQADLKKYFSESELLIPRDLQTHVSTGASIHSLIYNGFNKNIIQPITSEPFLVITKDETPKVILRAGTHIPCNLIVIDDLVTGRDGQPAIELPICLGNKNKLLYNIKIVSSNPQGFRRNTAVKLEIEITADKLLLTRATADGQSVIVDPINPFANKELTTEERIVLKAERQANIEAEQNGGKPTKASLQNLIKAYHQVGNDFRAAETMESLNDLYPNSCSCNDIGVSYSNAGNDEKALEYYEKAYTNNRNATSAFNYAHSLKNKDKNKFKEILEESLRLDPDMPYTLYELGRLLNSEGNDEGKEMIQKAFELWKKKFDTNRMNESDYSWLSSAADELGIRDFAKRVRESKPQFNEDRLYNADNLTVTVTEIGLRKF
jgi:molecular chaperone DnaK (HSP70)